ncbi:uncharacterized protein LOC144884617 [Branchiostoma floridae x Branchiostoma japonicum]
MTVTYEGSTNGNASSVSAVLFDTEQRLNSDGNNAQNRQCVYAPCERPVGINVNQREVQRFNETYAPGKNYSCLYHPDAPTKVILKRLFTWNDMFHSMLWSSIGFVIFACITLYILVECKKVKDKMRSVQVPTPAVSARAQPGHFLPPQAMASGQYLPPPPTYPGVQSGDSLPMQPAPLPQNLYDTNYSNFSQQKTGFTYN